MPMRTLFVCPADGSPLRVRFHTINHNIYTINNGVLTIISVQNRYLTHVISETYDFFHSLLTKLKYFSAPVVLLSRRFPVQWVQSTIAIRSAGSPAPPRSFSLRRCRGERSVVASRHG